MSKPYIPNDKLAQKAYKDNYRARSVYKLKELDHRYNILRHGLKVLDLAAAPGSWSQYASEQVGPTGHILSLDIQQIKPIAQNVTTVVCDISDKNRVGEEIKKLGWEKVDLVISDIAPSTTGMSDIDHSRSIELNSHIFELSKLYLKTGGKLIMKIFDGPTLKAFINELKKYFKKVEVYKSTASRERSRELYVTCS